MMDVAITERGASSALLRGLFPHEPYSRHFSDEQFVKRLLNQFKALDSLYSSWDKNNKCLFWGLTKKGMRERDKMILFTASKDT